MGVPADSNVMLHDGAEAVNHISSVDCSRAHVMLLDIMMPGVTGLEVMASSRPPCPVIAMTGSVDEESMAAYRRLDFDGILAKPFSGEQLQHAIISAVGVYDTKFARETEHSTPIPTSRMNRTGNRR